MRNLKTVMTAIVVAAVPLASGCPKDSKGNADAPRSSSPSSPPVESALPASPDDTSPPVAADDATPTQGDPNGGAKPEPATGPPPADIQLGWAKSATSATVRRLTRTESGYEPSGAAKTMPAGWARQMTALLKGVVARGEPGVPAKRCRFDPGIAVSLEQPNGATAYAELCFTCGDVRFGEHTWDFLPDAGRFKALVRKAFPSGGLEPVESDTK